LHWVARELLRFSRLRCDESAEPLKFQFSGRVQGMRHPDWGELWEIAEGVGETLFARPVTGAARL